MTDKLMYVSKDYTQNYPFCILQLVVETFAYATYWIEPTKQNSIEVPKVVKSTNKKMLLYKFGD